MKIRPYGPKHLAAWCVLWAIAFFAIAFWFEAKLDRYSERAVPESLVAKLKTTDNVEALRVAALSGAQDSTFIQNYLQLSLPIKAFIPLCVGAALAFVMTAGLAWSMKQKPSGAERE